MSELLLAPPDSIAESRLDSDARVRGARRRHDWSIWRVFVWLNVAALLLYATTLRFEGLGNLPGINGDEAWYGVQAEALLHGQQISWRTPSGNLLNPFFFFPTVLLHAVFAPSFVVLRATAVLSGLLALALNFWLCRRVFGHRIALISTMFLAVLPIDIAYGRIAWDASQSLLATLPCVYLPLWAVQDNARRMRLTVATSATLLIAIIVHPTNLFIAPVALAPLAYTWRGRLEVLWQRIALARERPRVRWALIGFVGGLAIVVALSVKTLANSSGSLVWPAMERGLNPQEMGEFTANFGRLFSGATVYEYFSGAIRPAAETASHVFRRRSDYLPFDVAVWLVAAWMLWGLAAGKRRNRKALTCLTVGWVASLLGFYLVAGPGGLAPSFERYAIWTIAPAAILVSSGIDGWLARGRRAGKFSTVVTLTIAWAMLIAYQVNCLDFIRQTGGESHRTYRTAAIEPKEAAIAFIRAESESGRNVRIVTSEWWLYWPMRYLAFADAHRILRVEMAPAETAIDRWQHWDSRNREQSWFVEFTGSAACHAIRRSARDAGWPLRETTIADFAGRPLLSLLAIQQSAAVHAPSLGQQSQTCSIATPSSPNPKSGSLENN